MSRLANKPIVIPEGVDCTVAESTVSVKGKKGELSHTFPGRVNIAKTDEGVRVTPPDFKVKDEAKRAQEVRKRFSAELGMTAAMIKNMLQGVTEGFKQVLVIEGVGYRAAVEGKTLVLQLGYSHDVRVDIPDGISVVADPGTRDKSPSITVEGADKQLVGFIADIIRGKRSVEPYKGKGIRYEGEYVRRKEGKAAGK